MFIIYLKKKLPSLSILLIKGKKIIDNILIINMAYPRGTYCILWL